MGYALMSARKISLTSKINRLNFQIMCLSQAMEANACKMQNLERLMNAQTNWNTIMQSYGLLGQVMNNGNLSQYLTNSMGGCGNILGSGLNNLLGGCSSGLGSLIGGMMGGLFGNSYSSPMINTGNFMDLFWPYAQTSMIDDDIECQKKQLETQLQVATKELEAVEKAEESAIGRATPKYA